MNVEKSPNKIQKGKTMYFLYPISFELLSIRSYIPNTILYVSIYLSFPTMSNARLFNPINSPNTLQRENYVFF